jgi:phenylacetate-CoA ligase
MPQATLLARAMQMLDATQWQRPEEIAALQFRKLLTLARHCETHSPHFRARLQSAGLTAENLSSTEGFARLPILSRRQLQGATDLFCTQIPSAHLPTYDTRTSGSTGEPVLIRRTAYSQLDWLSTTMREHLWHQRNFLAPLCAVRANIFREMQSKSWGAPAALLRPTGPALGIPITTSVARMAELIGTFAPETLLIYPSALAGLMQHLKAHALALSSVKKILTIGETLSSDTRTEAASFFGSEISDMYSSQEAGNIAIQCPTSGLYHVMAENLIVEVLNGQGHPASVGEAGRVVLTDLNNFATPLIRYDIGDFAEAGPLCPCGRGLPTLNRILGRERNLILMPDGSRHWPLVGFHKFRETAPIVQYQLIQRDRKNIEVRLVVERALTKDEEYKLIALIQTALGYPFALALHYFADRIPPGPNGKFEEFVSHAV